MKLSKAARAILSITALAWSIPFAQATDDRPDADERIAARLVDESPRPVESASLEITVDGAVRTRQSPRGDG